VSSTAGIDPRHTGQIDTRKLPRAKAVIISAAIAAITATLAVIKETSAFQSPTVWPSHVTPREAAFWHAQDGKLLWLADPAGEHGVVARSKGDPNHCAIAAYHGSWERPGNCFAEMVLATAAKGDGPDFEMPAGTGDDTGEVSDGAVAGVVLGDVECPEEPTPNDDERARQSSLFPVMAKPSDSSPGPQATGLPLVNRKTTLKRSL
jgi:hypothetical protein